MAQTGRTDIGVTLAPGNDGLNEPLDEKAAQTWPIGAIVQESGGYAIVGPDGALTTGYGFAMDEGQDLATDGAAKASIQRFVQGGRYVMTLAGVLDVTDVLAVARVNQTTGVPLLTIDGAGTWIVIGPAPGWAHGDTTARVICTPKDSFVEGGGGQ